jgi:1,4-alpha-glucan branching enzyme
LAFDPLAEATFRAAKLDWSEPATPEGRATVAFYRDLIALRAAAIVPRLAGIAGHAGQYEILGDRAFRVAWRLPEGAKLLLAANIGPAPQPASGWPDAAPLRLEGQLRPDGLGPWTAAVWLIEAENPRLDYG